VAGAHDPGRPVHVDAHIPLVRHDRLAAVNTDAHAHGSVCERVLGLSGGGDRIAGARERDEERIPLRIHLDPAVPREDVAQRDAMLRKHIGVALPVFLKQARRAFYVREEEGDGAAREFPHVQMIAPRRRPAKTGRQT
jgi:hypothetical protein